MICVNNSTHLKEDIYKYDNIHIGYFIIDTYIARFRSKVTEYCTSSSCVLDVLVLIPKHS